MKLRIVEKLGCGYFACAYLVRYEDHDENFGNLYAMRVSRYPVYDLTQEHNTITNEVEFMKFAKQHPDFFSQLKFNPWVERNYVMPDAPKVNTDPQRGQYAGSPFTLFQVYNYMGVRWLNKYIAFNFDMKMATLVQIIYAITLMNEAGYYHRDLNLHNIVMRQVPADTELELMIGGKKVMCPTFGWIIALIDFASVLHKDWDWVAPTAREWMDATPNEIINFLFELFSEVKGQEQTVVETSEIEALVKTVTDNGRLPLQGMEKKKLMLMHQLSSQTDQRSLFGNPPSMIAAMLPLVYKPVELMHFLLDQFVFDLDEIEKRYTK